MAIRDLQQSPAAGVDQSSADGDRRAIRRTLVACAVFALIVIVAHTARNHLEDPRLKNPSPGKPAVERLLGWDGWIDFNHVLICFQAVFVICVIVLTWRRRPEHHQTILMALACTSIMVQDPIMNWAPYAVYDPKLWHLPESWTWVYLAPTVEPFVVVGYSFLFVGPYFPAIATLRRLQRGGSPESFVSKHPLICLALLTFVYGFIIDALLETTLVWMGLYIYSQVIPFGSIFVGTFHQFPLIWESALITTTMIAASVLLYRDDTGKTVAEKLTQRARIFANRPQLGSAVVMIIICNLTYTFLYGLPFAIIRASGAATAVACPWPYPDSKVYDPQGFYEKAGQPGPFFPGMAAGWQTAQPNGRPQVSAPVSGGRCSP